MRLLIGIVIGIVLMVFILSPLLQKNAMYKKKEKHLKDKLADRDREVEGELRRFFNTNLPKAPQKRAEYEINKILDGSSF